MPFYTYANGAVIGGVFSTGTSYPLEYAGNYFWGDYNHENIQRLVFDDVGDLKSVEDFYHGADGLVKVFLFPDGNVGWISIWRGLIFKFVHSSSAPLDTAPPTIIAVTAGGSPAKIAVEFSEPIEQGSAKAVVNYQINHGVSEVAATLEDDLRTVTIIPSHLSDGIVYSLSVNGIKDRAGIPNTIKTDTRSYFRYVLEVIWVDDGLPAGAEAFGNWTWGSSDPLPFSGALAHQLGVHPWIHEHYFNGADEILLVEVGDTLITYVYLDPNHMPIEIMLMWEAGDWEHRAYWGGNLLLLGVDGADSRRYMGSLPQPRHWVRLEVPAKDVGLEGKTVTGMSFALVRGSATWDYTGKAERSTLNADLNQDGVIGEADLRIVAAALGSSPETEPRADLNDDSVIDIRDLAIVAISLGVTLP